MSKSISSVDIGPEVLGDVRKQMQIDEEWLVSKPRKLTWWGHRLAQTIWAQPAVVRMGMRIVSMQAETDLLVEVPDEPKTEQAIATLNATAALNTIIWHRKDRRVGLRCSTCIHPQVRWWLTKVFSSAVAMQVAEAENRVELLRDMVGGKVAISGHPDSGKRREPDDMLNVLSLFTTKENDPSPFAGAEMLSLCAFLEQHALANGSQTGVTVEFPFPGAIPPTVLVRVLADVSHPTYGAGVFLLMKLPSVPRNIKTGANLPNELNVAEIGQIDAGHGFGSWCLDVEDLSPTAYVSFLPAALFMPGLLQDLVASLAVKAQWTHLWLDLGNNAAELEGWHELQLRLLEWLARAAKP